MQSDKNIEIRKKMRDAGMTFETLASVLGMSVSSAYRMLASDLMDEDVESLLKIIDSYGKGKNGSCNKNL